MTDYSDYKTKTDIDTHEGSTSSVHNFDSSGNAPSDVHDTTAHSGTIGTEDQIVFDTANGHAHTGSDSTVIAWSNILDHPTAVSQFTNDPPYLTEYCIYCSYCSYCTYC